MSDAKETIGRAVAKVKGECWHEYNYAFDIWDTCPQCLGRPRPDYTSEGRIREAVRVLCVTDRHYDDVLRSIIAHYSLGYMYPRPAGWTFKTLKAVLTAPAEVLVNALLPIAEEVLKEGE